MTQAEATAIIGKVFGLVPDSANDIKEAIAVTFLASILSDYPDRMVRESKLQRLISDLRNSVDDLGKLQAARSPEEWASTFKDIWLRDAGKLPPDDKRSLH